MNYVTKNTLFDIFFVDSINSSNNGNHQAVQFKMYDSVITKQNSNIL